jgi:Mg-chelatase subunit ChlD
MATSRTNRNMRPTFTASLRRPVWASSRVRQRAILALDATFSMTGEKARAAHAAAVDLVRELARPENRGAFDVAVVTFDTKAAMGVALQSAADALPLVERLDPMGLHGGATNLTAGLAAAERMLGSAAAGGPQEAQPVVVLMTDGGHNDGPHPRDAANRVKGRGAFLVCVAFGDDADETLLKALASDRGFFRCRSGAELRTFFADVAATLSASLPRGIPPGASIPTLQR